MSSINLDTRVKQQADVLTADVDDAVMLMAIDNGNYFDMQKTASHIWSAIATPKAVSEIVEELLGIYDVKAEQCQNAVIGFLDKLLAEGIIEIVEAEKMVKR